MLKMLVYVALAIILLLNGMVYSVIQGTYVLNKASIIENFCINKAQTELQCDGKCYLAQQLKAERDKRDQESQHTFSADFGQFIANTPFSLNVISFACIDNSHPGLQSTHFVSSFFASVETPPKI
ncbi:hypothetical protein [Lunatimonas salinarum]|uniref:hypothetical protein n=1 Tax=Lunatimonas salinarum TaxID=1774590 RepID=UPI001ADFE7C5|nr:hypothetical protein [Lunatimonas salinarum]